MKAARLVGGILCCVAMWAHAQVTQQCLARYHGPANGNDYANAIAVDGVGNVYVTGGSWGGASGWDYATVAYDAATGNQLWVARYNGPGNSNDTARAIAVDGVGNVYVTGYSDGGASGNDYATVAYDAATGNQLWVARYNGLANAYDSATAIAVDGVRSVYVTGFSWGGFATQHDYVTLAYDAATGNQLWVTRYNGPANGDDFANAIAVDGVGNVYVTGESNGASGSDYATIKYSQP